MRRSSSILTTRRTHSSSISRQAQVIPLTSSTVVPLPQPPQPPTSPGIRAPPPQTPRSPNTEKVKEWVDIFDGPLRPPTFTSSGSTSHPTSGNDGEPANSIIFDGPARPRYIIPAASFHTQNQQARGKQNAQPTSSTTTQSKDVSALLSRSSLPPPRIYDGPAFEWELQTKRV